MKFKLLFVLFNIVIVLSFALIVFMPLLVLGWDYSRVFWSGNWPVAIIFVAVLAALNTYFILNWKLFSLLEAQDWKALTGYLEDLVLKKNRVSRQRIRVLINAYVISGLPSSINRLHDHLAQTDAKWVNRFPLEFGMPHLLEQDTGKMLSYYGDLKADPNCREPIWVRWTYGFALILNREPEKARAELLAIADEPATAVQQLLIAYLLDGIAGGEEDAQNATRSLVTELKSLKGWKRLERELASNRSGLQALVLSKLIADAKSWLAENGDATDK